MRLEYLIEKTTASASKGDIEASSSLEPAKPTNKEYRIDFEKEFPLHKKNQKKKENQEKEAWKKKKKKMAKSMTKNSNQKGTEKTKEKKK